MTYNSPRTSALEQYPYKTEGHSKQTMKESNLSNPRKESSYYMDNYEATITVHKSPPQQRKQYNFVDEYLEIDDETNDKSDRIYPTSRLSKRKNLRVTFSDHIEVDFIEDVTEDFSEDDYDDIDGVVEETLYEIPFDRTKGLSQITSSAEFRSVTENISPTGGKSPNAQVDTDNVKPIVKNPVIKQPPRCQHQIQAAQQQQNQPLLIKRRAPNKLSLSDLEKKTKDYVTQLHDKTKRAETQARVAKAMFPDITAKVKAQPNYKQFIANAKRAVEITRRYERPWVHGAAATQQTFSVWRKKNETMRRTASLPKNFKLPDDLTRRPGSENVLLTNENRVRIRNT